MLYDLSLSADYMKFLKVERARAEKARVHVVRLNLLDSSRPVQHSRSYVYFPISIMGAKAKKAFDRMGAQVVSRREAKKGEKPSYREQLSRILTKKEFSQLARGYDQIGDIVVIEFTGSRSKEREIAQILIDSNISIKTVLAKAGAVRGKYRVRKLRYVAGIENFIATCRENGCTFRFDTRKVFFSNRLSYERSRILGLVKDRENVMVMFAGIGPFAIEIAKANRHSKIVAVELNRFGYRYMLENVKLNKVDNVKPVLGDVKRVSVKYRNFADRIIMPLPMSSMNFLDEAYKVARKRAIVHLYAFADKPETVKDAVRMHAKKKGYEVRFLEWREVRPYSTTDSEYAVDYQILK